ncbi:uncharacterized protein LOC112571696 [Pomacea canaliculata]|uniref:uncharacterized protein LOC112571696 n=1 Tax=Pomacea canaliculata TaxID=400727 RepID=UPI000D730478|nr:uncharacterized protein LOC112571696 [Pomacea canaliculata]XP_025106698.1 uncharacterized protein LOC112571696 [Pomacea canaliculata]XP_025106700.1 uncharacterized protein LOC112571696 [Pomacea canaliculata]
MNHWYFDTFEGTPEPQPQDPCAIITTTGAAGHHRLVLHSHRNIVAFSRVMVPRTTSTTQGFFLNSPFGSAIGHIGLSLYTGMKRVVMDARAGTPMDMAEFVCLALWEEQCTSAVIPPYLILQVAKKFVQTETAQKIMFIGVTGEKVNLPTIEAALNIGHVAVVSLVTAELFLTTLWMVTKAKEFRDCCVGAPIPSVQVRIVNDIGVPVPNGIKGNVEIRTPLIFRGYAHDLEATDACFTKDGYFKTNDLGWLMGDMLFVEGRRHDIITRGSLSFYPAWLEAAIEKCPGVVQAIVVGIPHEKLHQEICACVLTSNKDLTMTTIREFVENNFFKSPRPRFYLHFDKFPENQSDKANRDELALIAMRRLQ